METVDEIEQIVALMTPTVKIDEVIDNGDGTQTLLICNTYWMRKFLTVTIDGTEYEISAFDQNVSITIPIAPLVAVDSFVLQAPFYYHGTPIQANNEFLVEKRDNKKYPLIYLVESMDEFFYDEEHSNEKDSPLRILFLDSFENNKSEVDGHYTERIKPLVASCNFFVELLQDDPVYTKFTYNKNNRVKVGVETTNEGSTSQIFNDPLNAVEFVATVTRYKSTDDCSC